MGKKSRVKSRVSELPEEIKKALDEMLLDINFTYTEIAEEITKKGYPISKSSIGRYALRQNKATQRLKEACETTKLLVETVKENRDLDASEAATTILIDALMKRLATAEEEFENMPLDKAGRLIVQLQRSAVYKEKFKLEYKRGIEDALSKLKEELKIELRQQPELFKKMCELADSVSRKMESDGNG